MDEKLFCYLCRINTVKLLDIKDENGTNIKTIVLKHLIFIQMNDYLFDEKICEECWKELKEFNKFYNKIEQAQKCIFPFDQPKFGDDIKGEFIDIKIEPMEVFVEENDPVIDSKEEKSITKKKKKDKVEKRKKGDESDYSDSASISRDSSLSSEEDEYIKPMPKPRKKKKKTGKPSVLDEYAKLDIVIKEHMQITCNICEHPFETLSDMKIHCKDVHNKVGFVLCCGRQYKRRTHLHTHIMEHKFPEKYLVCDICHKKFKTKKSVDLHKKVVHTTDEERPYVCEKCPKRFALMSLLNGHRVFHDEKKMECPVCGKLATNSSLLNAHIRTHDVNRSHMCEVCSKSFLNAPSLKAHMMIHSTDKAHCGVCGLQVRDLKEHSKSHMDLQLPCLECDKILPTKAALKAHKRYHHRMERIFACTYCEKSFKRAISLKEHIATHTGEILYVCPHCPATFNSKANYYKHKKICAEKGSNQSLQ